jgi:hypothetical protein
VKVRAYVNGDWGSYGSVCTVTIPAILTTKLTPAFCDGSVPSVNSEIKCTGVAGATNYEYVFSNSTLGFADTVSRNARWTNLFLKRVPGLIAGNTYDVKIRAYFDGAWGDYGDVCSLTILSGLRLSNQKDEIESIYEGQSIINVYPNPFLESFTVFSTVKDVQVKIYDQLGRMRENINVSANSDYKFGKDLEAGFYVVEILTGNEKRFVRMIKND